MKFTLVTGVIALLAFSTPAMSAVVSSSRTKPGDGLSDTPPTVNQASGIILSWVEKASTDPDFQAWMNKQGRMFLYEHMDDPGFADCILRWSVSDAASVKDVGWHKVIKDFNPTSKKYRKIRPSSCLKRGEFCKGMPDQSNDATWLRIIKLVPVIVGKRGTVGEHGNIGEHGNDLSDGNDGNHGKDNIWGIEFGPPQ